jgi:hypothetical protein
MVGSGNTKYFKHNRCCRKKRATLIEQNGAGLPVIILILASAISGLISALA